MQKFAKFVFLVVFIVLCGFTVQTIFSSTISQERYNQLAYEIPNRKPEIRQSILSTDATQEAQSKTSLDDNINIEETSSETTMISTEEEQNNINWEKLKQENNDFAGWLNIPGTNISYPVVMTNDNDYYLSHDFWKKKSAAGTLFIDAYSPEGIDTTNLIIYGHNMKNRSMFGNLRKFRETEWFNNHSTIELFLKNETKIYTIFSVREVSSDINTLNYSFTGFNIVDYINAAQNQSIQKREVFTGEQIITLSTCVGNQSKRLLISGILNQ